MSVVRCPRSVATDNQQLTTDELPTRFHNAGNLSRQRQLAKANPAQMKLAQIGARSAAPFATRVPAGRKLRLAIRFRD